MQPEDSRRLEIIDATNVLIPFKSDYEPTPLQEINFCGLFTYLFIIMQLPDAVQEPFICPT